VSVVARRAKRADVAAVIGDLSSVSIAEVDLTGSSYDEIAEMALRGVAEGHAIAGEIDGVTGCLFWFFPGEGDCYTYFLAAQSYFDNPVAYTRATRDALAECAAQFPKAKLVSATLSPHPNVEKWFRTLGFTAVQESKDLKVFEYNPI